MLHTISIDGNDYTSYSTVAAADIRLSVDVVRRTTWNAATEADQGRALIAASDRIDALRFIGDPAAPGQPRKWPRSGVPDVADNAIPEAVVLATQLLAGDILEDPSAGRPRNPTAAIGSISKVKAGSVEVDYYTGARIEVSNAPINLLGAEIQPLLAPYLAVAASGLPVPVAASSADGAAEASGGLVYPPRLDYGLTR